MLKIKIAPRCHSTHGSPMTPTVSVCNCDQVTSKFKSFTIGCYIQCVLGLPFPLSKLTPLIDLQVLILYVAPTVSVVAIWGLSPNYLRPEVLHYVPRAVWMSRGVNHCQQHHLCLSWSWAQWEFSQASREITTKCWQISKSLLHCWELICWCWLIIQSSCTKEFCSSISQTVEFFFSWGGAMFSFHRQVSRLANLNSTRGFVVQLPQSFIRDGHRYSLMCYCLSVY